MTKNELAKKVSEVSLLHGHFLLRSGAVSQQYFDKYRFESQPELLLSIAEMIEPMIPKNTEALAGLELGGVPIATALSLRSGLPMVMVRKKAKTYGTSQLVEGMDVKNKRILIIEDIVTTGGQVKVSVENLRNIGAIVECALCVIDRSDAPTQPKSDEDAGPSHLRNINVTLRSLFKSVDLQPVN